MLKSKKLRIALISALLLLGLLSAAVAEGEPDYLVLVNPTHPISPDYICGVNLVDVDIVSGGVYQVEETTRAAFYALRDALLAEGVEIGVDSAYRSIERQQEIMDEFIETYGEEYAKQTVAQPGTSEHHTGLVIDIVPRVSGEWIVENEDMLRETEIFAAIHRMLPEYGFILRYPKGKEQITGYDYEPWHLRYVGKEAAAEIYESGLTLEEWTQAKGEQSP